MIRRDALALLGVCVASTAVSASTTDDATAIIVRIVRTGNQDPFTVTAHLEDKFVELVSRDKVLQHDIVRAVRALVEKK